MWNTDGGSMRGSGIYADSSDIDGLVCGGVIADDNDNETPCTFEGEVEVHFDDWSRGTWTCPVCESDNDYDLPEIGDNDDDYDYSRGN